MSPSFELAFATDAGKVRSHNEDAIAGDGQLGFAVLADGMGGHNAGEVASRIAVDLVSSGLRTRWRPDTASSSDAEALIGEQIAGANSAVLETAERDRAFRGMGTTLVVALWHVDGVSYGHVGDSRLYLLRETTLEQLTRDHSLVQEQLERGAITPRQARYALNRNILTRAVGIDPVVAAEIATIPTRPGDLFILCSDGLTDMLTDGEIASALLAHAENLQAAAHQLVNAANEAGGFDNISVVLAKV